MIRTKKNDKKQTALVTGGRIRLGAHIADHLEASGWAVLRHSSTPESGFISADFRDAAAVARLFEQLPPLDCVVHNAGVLWKNQHDAGGAIQQINTDIPLALARHVRGGGTQIFIGDADPTTDPDFSAYSASKITLRTAIPKLAAELIPQWRVHLLEISALLRAPTESVEHFEALRAEALLGGITFDDMTTTIDFLLNSERLTGQIISLDGGAGAGNRKKRDTLSPRL